MVAVAGSLLLPGGSIDKKEWLKGFDYIVLGLGSRKYDPLSEELKAFVPEVHVIGDAIKPGQSSDAMHQGFLVGYEL